MFKTARIKLTTWYLIILMLISISFSIIIYKMLSDEFDRFISRQRLRLELRMQDPIFYPSELPAPLRRLLKDPEIIEETKNRIIINLILTNAAIAILSGGLSYILAGRTLKPIQNMIDEQDRFTSDASHELRTPLTALKTNLEVYLRDKNLTVSSAKNLIKSCITDVNELQHLTDNLLELSQFTYTSTPALETINLKKLTENVISRINPVAKKKNTTLNASLQNGFINGHEESLIRLITILIDNAIKYSTSFSQITIKTHTDKNSVYFIVKDLGIGIPQSDLPHIFDRFYRADATRSKEKFQGYGLGLAIAKKIVSQLNGKIFVKSQLNIGSTFTVKFPVAK